MRYLCEGRTAPDIKFNARGEPAIYCGQSTMDNRPSYNLYLPCRPRPRFVCMNNVTFGNKFQIAKKFPDFINSWETALGIPL